MMKRMFVQGLMFAVFLAVCLGVFSAPAKANLVLNGGFESVAAGVSSPGAYFCQLGTTCISNVTSWSSECLQSSCGTGATPTSIIFGGTGGSAFNGGIGLYGTIGNSPDGGNFVAADSDPGGVNGVPRYNSRIFQTINGLVVNQNYTLTFYQAGAQQRGSGGATTDQWQVSLGASTQLGSVISVPSQGFSGWSQQVLNFRADATSEVLSFLAVGTPVGVPPVALLDGVNLVSTPEPSTFLMLFGAIGMAAGYAVRKRRAANRA